LLYFVTESLSVSFVHFRAPLHKGQLLLSVTNKIYQIIYRPGYSLLSLVIFLTTCSSILIGSGFVKWTGPLSKRWWSAMMLPGNWPLPVLLVVQTSRLLQRFHPFWRWRWNLLHRLQSHFTMWMVMLANPANVFIIEVLSLVVIVVW
jgi:hypothetical protein